MIPLRDNQPTERRAVLTIAFIVVNVAVFLWQKTAASPVVLPAGAELVRLSGFDASIFTWGLRPIEVIHGISLPPATPISDYVTPVTSMFLHGGWLHLGGNMLFLWIFGNNVEDSMGRLRFVVFYLIVGLVGAATQSLVHSDSVIPMVGASGAIAGIMGAYLLLHPRARVLTLIPVLFIFIVEIPAFVFLGLWIVLQLVLSAGGGSTAWFAHIGGFLAGVILIKLFARRRRRDSGKIAR